MPRRRRSNATGTNTSELNEKERAFWKAQFTANKENLGKVKIYRAGTDGRYRDTDGVLMEGGIREVCRSAP